jgi:hypothetical protein
MPELNLFQIFISRLNKLDMPYMVTGAVASVIYGEPRLTHDIDVVLDLSEDNVERFVKAFVPEEFYCPPIEVIRLEIRRQLRGHFNLIHQETGFKADIYTVGQDELHHWAMMNRKGFEMEGEPIWLAPPEYVILRKLEYYREGRSDKHLRDIASIIEISSDQIDFEQLQKRIKTYALEEEWQKAQNVIKKYP